MDIRPFICVGLAWGILAARAGVEPGDPAPRLDDSVLWLQGEPVDPGRADGHSRLVLAFWSPSSSSSPDVFSRLQRLEERYRASGLTVATLTADDAEAVRGWLDGLTVRLPVALDTNHTADAAFLADVEGLPYAFLVDTNGVVAWSGDPLNGLEDAIEGLFAGTYDVEKARAERRRHRSMDRALEDRDIPRALALADELLAGAPRRPDLLRLKAGLLVESGDAAGYREHVRRMAAAFSDSAQDLNNLAWTLAGPSDLPLAFRDLETALDAARRAADLTQRKEAVVLDTLAAVWFQLGLPEQAAAVQAEAVAACSDPDQRKKFQDTLEYYRRIPAWRDAARPARPASPPGTPAPTPAPAASPPAASPPPPAEPKPPTDSP